ncbi:MAG: transporter [Muribaculaceae bacterium]|nr:transporter [Muribaculaceae bacterium]
MSTHIQLHLRMATLRSLMLPLAMLTGAVFYKWMGELTFLSPYLIFSMLFITYCRLDPAHIRPGKEECILLALQWILAGVAFFIFRPLDLTLAQGIFICIYCPTATAAPVITSMLGGSISRVATYSLIGNVAMAIAGPAVLALVGDSSHIPLLHSALIILKRVMPLLLLPLLAAWLLRWASPRAHSYICTRQQLSFYIWAISLVIIVGSCVSFAISHWTQDQTVTIILLALGALAACLIQFKAGRTIGRRFGDPVSGAQGLAQKNTVLAVWLALTYLNPLASLAPAAYIAWQNIINSWQLMRKSDSKA